MNTNLIQAIRRPCNPPLQPQSHQALSQLLLQAANTLQHLGRKNASTRKP